MTAFIPAPGAPFESPAPFLDESIGYGTGWIAWFFLEIIFVAELIAIGLLYRLQSIPYYLAEVHYPQQNLQWPTHEWEPSILISLLLTTAILVNSLPAKLYGRVVYYIDILKMFFVVGLILFQLIINIQLGLSDTFYLNPYSQAKEYLTTLGNITCSRASSQLARIWGELTVTIFSLIWFEPILVTAAETREFAPGTQFVGKGLLKISPRKIITRILLLCIMSTSIITFNIRVGNDNLSDVDIRSLGSGQRSAFIIPAVRTGEKLWPSFINGLFILSATLTAINSLRLSSRLLHTLALSKPVWPDYIAATQWQSWLQQISINYGVPRNAVVASSVFGILGYVSSAKTPAQYLGRLAINFNFSMLIVYVVVCATFLRFKVIIYNALESAHLNELGSQRDSGRSDCDATWTYPYKHRWQPFRAFLASLICLLIVLFNGWRMPHPSVAFLASYISVIILVLLWLAFRIRAIRQSDTRLWKLARTLDTKGKHSDVETLHKERNLLQLLPYERQHPKSTAPFHPRAPRSVRNHVKRFLRPKMKPGMTRLVWTCSCGDELYADFKDTGNGSLQALAIELQASITVHFPGSKPATESSASLTKSTPSSNAGVPQANPMNPNRNLSAPGPHSTNSPPTLDASGLYAGSSGSPSANKKFLALCIHQRKKTHKLGEVDVGDTTSDGSLFDRIRAVYVQNRRGFRLFGRFALHYPIAGNFTKLRVYRSPDVFVDSGPPSFPPQSEVIAKRYSYTPVPMDEPAMTREMFVHFLNGKPDEHPQCIWTKRFPAKLNTRLFHTGKEGDTGWGVEIQEGPNMLLFALLSLAALLLSIIVASLVCILVDSQTGVGIGQWLTSVQALVITALLMRWAEDLQ